MMQARRYKAIMEATESFVKKAMGVQVLDDLSPDYGGFPCPDILVCEPLAAANAFTTMTVMFFSRDSDYYHSLDLLQRIKLALGFIIRSQHEDGTIDSYITGDINSISSLAYAMCSLLKAYKFFAREVVDREILNSLELFLKRGIKAIKSQSCPIASQRWIEASVLVEFEKIFLDHLAVSKAEDYLNNSVEINHDGLYSDRSPTQSMTSNAMLLNIAKRLNKPYLIENVRRNLNFSLYNFYPNGEIVTEYSLKLQAELKTPQGYGVWKEMSIIDHNGYYASAADMVLDEYLSNMQDGYIVDHSSNNSSNYRKEGGSRFFATSSIGELLIVEDEFNNDAVHRISLPCHYKKVFPNSNIARFQNGKTGATIIGNSSILMTAYNGQAIIDGFRIRYAYYGQRDFLPKKLEVATKSYILRDWFNQWQPALNYERTEPANVDLRIIAEFTPKENGIDIDISATGQKGIPLQLEFGVRNHGKLFLNNCEYDMRDIENIFMLQGDAIIRSGDDQLMVRGGVVQHKIYNSGDQWTTNPNIIGLILTPITPYLGKIQIIWN